MVVASVTTSLRPGSSRYRTLVSARITRACVSASGASADVVADAGAGNAATAPAASVAKASGSFPRRFLLPLARAVCAAAARIRIGRILIIPVSFRVLGWSRRNHARSAGTRTKQGNPYAPPPEAVLYFSPDPSASSERSFGCRSPRADGPRDRGSACAQVNRTARLQRLHRAGAGRIPSACRVLRRSLRAAQGSIRVCACREGSTECCIPMKGGVSSAAAPTVAPDETQSSAPMPNSRLPSAEGTCVRTPHM